MNANRNTRKTLDEASWGTLTNHDSKALDLACWGTRERRTEVANEPETMRRRELSAINPQRRSWRSRRQLGVAGTRHSSTTGGRIEFSHLLPSPWWTRRTC